MRTQRRLAPRLAALAAALAVVGGAASASGQNLLPCVGGADVPEMRCIAVGGGITGLTLIGAELTFNIEVLAGLRNPWIVGFTTLAAAGGAAVGGYYMEKAIDDYVAGGADAESIYRRSRRLGAVKVVVLAVGMAGILPTLIIWNSADFRARRGKGASKASPESKPAGGSKSGPEDFTSSPGGVTPSGSFDMSGLFNLNPAGLALSAPAIDVGPSLARAKLGAVPEAHVTVFTYTF